MTIADLVIEQQNKIFNEYRGGFKYGHDFNILKAILDHLKNERLVENLVKGIRSEELREKTKEVLNNYARA